MSTPKFQRCITFVKNQLNVALFSSQPKRAAEKLGKVINVAIIGAPNTGKSTLINNIVDRKVCAASNKVHTTTKLIRAMCFQDDTQIVFLDTPGVITENEKKRFKLPQSMIGACEKSLRCADVIGVVHDVSNRYTQLQLHKDVITMLQMVNDIPSFLILNKVDKLKFKKQILSVIRNLCNGIIAGKQMPGFEKKRVSGGGYSGFSDVFLVSALNGDGVQDIKNYLISNAKPSNFQYSPDKWTDQEPTEIIQDAVRAKFLDFLSHEIPYNLDIRIEYYEEIEEENKIMASVIVECPTERLLKLIAGAGGGRLQQIKSLTRTDLMAVFNKTVNLDIQIKAKNKPLSDTVSVT